jgi:VCBS repeat-containing protein
MRTVKFLFVVLAAIFTAAAAREARAQQADPYVSCVKCHALPMQQALAQLQGHGSGYPPAPEQACSNCHETWMHEQDPNAAPYTPYFLWRTGGSGSLMAQVCVGCHASLPANHHASDVFPYFDGSAPTDPPLLATEPTPVLPLFGLSGEGSQDPYAGLVCSTCHDPHNSSYLVNGRPSFLRIGSHEQTAPLCGYCHDQGSPTAGADLFIPSDSDSVRFELLPGGELQIDVTVQNRGNAYPDSAYGYVDWDDGSGYRIPVGPLYAPFIPPGGEGVASAYWAPPPDWTYGEGFFVFQFPSQPLLESYYAFEFVRSMDVTPAPTNLRVTSVGAGTISLAWNLPSNRPADLAWDVYRDGVKITPMPIYSPTWVDTALAPETPHVYTVVAVRTAGGLPSQPSDPVGGTTTTGTVVRVPQDYPTIQQAIDAAWSGTSIHVAPGTYTETLSLAGKHAITIKGQDANGCVLDYSDGGAGMPIDLGYGQPGNTLAGFTVRNASINMDAGDVVTACVLAADSQHPNPVIAGGGLVAQCVIDTSYQPAVYILPNQFLASVNSIYFGSQPFGGEPASRAALLLNNAFPDWPGWMDCEGSGNLWDVPQFAPPGPPTEYYPAASPTLDAGLPLGAPYLGTAPDVGVFEFGQYYTPQPPANLVAAFAATPYRHIQLTWTASIDDPARMYEYRIFRSTDPSFPSGTDTQAYATVAVGNGGFDDYDVEAGTTYYYQVRAFAGPTVPPSADELLSAPTNTASAQDVNNPPVAVDDVASAAEGLPVTIDVLANDSDPDGDVFHVLDVGFPQHGTATMNPDETIEYTPYFGFTGSDSFTYTVVDVRYGSATAVVTVTVGPNAPPVAFGDTFETLEDAPLSVPAPGVLANDADPDGDALEALLVAGPTHGTVSLNLDGSFVYTPAASYSGPDSFTYFAGDLRLASAPATVTITVRPTNTPPVANNQTLTTAEDTAVGVTLTATDVDGDALSYSVSPGPAHGTLSGASPNLTYTPNAGFSGSDTFSFTASDGQAASAPATVTIVVTPVNDPPTAGNDTYSTLEDAAVIVIEPGVLGNDTDAEGATLNAALVSGPLHGTLSLDALGGFTYTPAADFSGSDSFTYRASDGQATSAVATVTIAVAPVNDQPVASGQAATTPEDTILRLTVSGTDVDHDLLSYRVVQAPAHGWVSGTAQFLSYTPSANFNGTDSFTFVVSDGQVDSSEATVTITVTPVDDWPQAQGQAVATAEDTPVPVTLVATDVDDDPLTFALVSLPAHGSLVGTAPNLTYVPAANYYDVDSFTFTASDGRTTTPVTTVSITVTPVNDPPSFVMGPDVTVNEDADVQTIPSWATGIDDGDPVGSQVLTFTLTNDNPALFNLQPRISSNGTLTFAAPTNAHGTATVTVTLTDDDRAGGAAITTPPQTFTITVVSVNDPPWAWAQSVSAAEDTATPVTLTALETEGDALTYAIAQGPTHGTLSGVGANLTYTPAANYNGPDSFTFTANDGQADSNVARVTINVSPVNDAPTVTGGTGSFVEDTPRTVAAPGVLNYAADIDSVALSAVLVQGTAHGSLTLNANGSYTYAPAADYTGPDSFTYRASDGQAESNVGTITITVTPVNDPPVASAKSYTTSEDAQLIVDAQAGLLAGATDVDSPVTSGGPHSYPSHGILQWESNGSFRYTPAANFSGTDSFTYFVSDGWANSADQTVTITVTAANDPPAASDDTAATAAHVPVLVAVLGNDTDADGDTLSVGSATPGANGSTAVQADGRILYTPNPGFTGTDSFSYVVDDGHGGTNTAAVTVSVRPQRLRITALTMATVTSSRYTNASATALAVDESGAPLAGVRVDGRWSGLTGDVDTGVTGADGQATVSSSQVRNANGTFTFTIDTALKAGYELDGPASVLSNAVQYPAPPPPGGEMHVASIAMGLKTGKNTSTSATATVTVVDANGVPVASASLSGSWSGAVGGTPTGTTGADGKVTLSSAGIKIPAGKTFTFTFTVTGITKSGWSYDSAANVETEGSITAP